MRLFLQRSSSTKIADNGASAQKKPRLNVLESYVKSGVKANKVAAKEQLQNDVDHIVMRLICVRGMVPNILNSPEWAELMTRLNPDYKPSSSSKFADNFVPKEASFVRQEQLKKLQQQENMTMSFDGGSTRNASLYLAHATTAADPRHSYFVEGHVGTDEHHTVDWVTDHIMKVCASICASIVVDCSTTSLS